MSTAQGKAYFNPGEPGIRKLSGGIKFARAVAGTLLVLGVLGLIVADARVASEWSQLGNPSCNSFQNLGLILALSLVIPLLAGAAGLCTLIARRGFLSKSLKFLLSAAIVIILVSGSSALALYSHGRNPSQHCKLSSLASSVTEGPIE